MGNNGAEIKEFEYVGSKEAAICVRWWNDEDEKWVYLRGNIEETDEEEPNYKEAYDLLMDHWDSIPDEDKEQLSKRLEALGL